MTALAGVVALAGGVVVQSWEASSFPFVAVLLLMCTTCALTALVAAPLVWFPPLFVVPSHRRCSWWVVVAGVEP
jgi:hypothetical protein